MTEENQDKPKIYLEFEERILLMSRLSRAKKGFKKIWELSRTILNGGNFLSETNKDRLRKIRDIAKEEGAD